MVKKILLWIKFPIFLCCWNEVGISKVASMIGVPLDIDSLTATKTHISFSQVCIKIILETNLPNPIPINLNGLKFDQVVVYDWKHMACSKCNAFSHEDRTCPLNSNKFVQLGEEAKVDPPSLLQNLELHLPYHLLIKPLIIWPTTFLNILHLLLHCFSVPPLQLT